MAMLKKVAKFMYLGDIRSSEGGVQEAVTAITCGWKQFKDIASVLCKRVESLKLKRSVYESCIKSALCYGVESWVLKKIRESCKLPK